MAKKSSLAAALKDDGHLTPVTSAPQRAGNGRRLITEGTSLVAGNLPIKYGRTLALIAAEEGVTKKDLLQEAIDLLLAARGRGQR
jgi:hypothetical protein